MADVKSGVGIGLQYLARDGVVDLRSEQLSHHVIVIVGWGNDDVNLARVIRRVAFFRPFHHLVFLNQVPPALVQILVRIFVKLLLETQHDLASLFCACSLALKSSSLPDTLAFHQARLADFSNGRILASCSAMNLRARASSAERAWATRLTEEATTTAKTASSKFKVWDRTRREYFVDDQGRQG